MAKSRAQFDTFGLFIQLSEVKGVPAYKNSEPLLLIGIIGTCQSYNAENVVSTAKRLYNKHILLH